MPKEECTATLAREACTWTRKGGPSWEATNALRSRLNTIVMNRNGHARFSTYTVQVHEILRVSLFICGWYIKTVPLSPQFTRVSQRAGFLLQLIELSCKREDFVRRLVISIRCPSVTRKGRFVRTGGSGVLPPRRRNSSSTARPPQRCEGRCGGQYRSMVVLKKAHGLIAR